MTTDRAKLEGLAEWLRYEAERYDPFNEAVEARAKRLNRWASEVEALKGSAAPAVAGVMDERERCARICEMLAALVDDGAGMTGRLWQAAREIRSGDPVPSFYDPTRKEPDEPREEGCSSTAARAGESQGWTQAARDVLAERQRQIDKEGWTLERDSDHYPGDLAAAAACYATGVPDAHTLQYNNGNEVWPWSPDEFKPGRAVDLSVDGLGPVSRIPDFRRDLVRAGALILAEIERLDRAATPPKEPTHG